MKRIRITLAAILVTAFPLFSQNVNIPDEASLNALIELGVDVNDDGQIDSIEANAIDHLFLREKGIADLTGIEAFINLDSLYCNFNYSDNLSENVKRGRRPFDSLVRINAVRGNVEGCGEGKMKGHRPASGRCPVMSG